MVDGQVFRANSFLQPGWQLQMPHTSDAAGDLATQLGNDAPAADEKSEHVVTVQSGDYLSKIAEEQLGDANDWPQLFDASRGTPQPDGLPAITDPDLIRPGQQVTVPGTQPEQPPQERESGGESGSTETTPPPAKSPTASRTRARAREMSKRPRPATRQHLILRRRPPAHRQAALPNGPTRIRPLRPHRPLRHPGPPPRPPPSHPRLIRLAPLPLHPPSQRPRPR